MFIDGRTTKKVADLVRTDTPGFKFLCQIVPGFAEYWTSNAARKYWENEITLTAAVRRVYGRTFNGCPLRGWLLENVASPLLSITTSDFHKQFVEAVEEYISEVNNEEGC